MKKEYPKYSVLMSVYIKENPEWLKCSIDSMLNQTVKPDEIVLVEDGPLTDNLKETIKQYQSKYPNIFNIISLKKNVGLGPALNIGINNCKNEYIARMDTDDYSMPNRIQSQLEVFERDNELGMVGTNVSEFIDDINNVVCNVILPENNNEIINYSKKRNPFRHPSILFKKSAVLKAGNYREYYLCEDYDMWVRMIRSGCRCYNIQNIYVYMRINEDFYKRRGGIKYLRSILKFKREQLNCGYFTKVEHIKSILPHIIICLIPNRMRDFVYKRLLREKKVIST